MLRVAAGALSAATLAALAIFLLAVVTFYGFLTYYWLTPLAKAEIPGENKILRVYPPSPFDKKAQRRSLKVSGDFGSATTDLSLLFDDWVRVNVYRNVRGDLLFADGNFGAIRSG